MHLAPAVVWKNKKSVDSVVPPAGFEPTIYLQPKKLYRVFCGLLNNIFVGNVFYFR